MTRPYKPFLTLIDSDYFAYKIGFSCEDEPLQTAFNRLDEEIEVILALTQCDSYVCYLTGKDNYRDRVATIQKYKDRIGTRPDYYEPLRAYIVAEHNGQVINGQEADDACGIMQCDPPEGWCTCVCSNDKDLDMIPGWHYKWRPKKPPVLWEQGRLDAYRFFCTQLLTGDTVDTIPGLYRMTGKRATAQMKKRLDIVFMRTQLESVLGRLKWILLELPQSLWLASGLQR